MNGFFLWVERMNAQFEEEVDAPEEIRDLFGEI